MGGFLTDVAQALARAKDQGRNRVAV